MSECESTLQQHLPSIRLLGQLPLSDSDVERLFAYIQQNLGGKVSANLPDAIEDMPAVLACYLVWKGIQDYDEGTYWRSLSSELGPLDTNQQIKLGRFFRKFIETHDLLSVEIPDSQKNITPILLHGIIPRAQVPQFFDQVVYPLVRKELVNPRSRYELAFWLENRRIAAKRAEQLESLQKKLKRLEDAEKPMAGEDLAQLKREIQQIEEQITKEEANLANLQTELHATHYNPTALTGIEDDLKTIQRQEGAYKQALDELEGQKHILDEKHGEIQQYNQIGIVEPLTIENYDAFRRATYTAIISTMAAALDNPEEPQSAEAHVLLTTLCGAVAEGTLSLPDELVRQLEALRSTHGTIEGATGPPTTVEDEYDNEEDSPISPGSEAASDIEIETKDCSDTSLPSHSSEIALAPDDDAMDPDITISGPRLILYQSPSTEDEELISRYAGLHDMCPSDADMPDQEDKGLTVSEVTTANPIKDRISVQEDSPPSNPLESRNCAGSEGLSPPTEDILPVFDHNVPQETSTDTDTSAVNSSGSGQEQQFRQEVIPVLHEELEIQTPLEPEVPLVPFEPESPTRCAEDTLHPMNQMRESTPYTRTMRHQQAERQTTRTISTLIDAIIGILSQLVRGRGR